MAVPIAQATVSGFHTIELPNNILAPTFTVPLMGDATGAPIEEWEWNVAASGENHRGGAPYGSLVASGVKGSFTDGVAKVQNPTAVLDTPGGYTFSLRTRNTDGWSDPSYTGDGWRCQTNAYVLTQAGLKLPAPNQYNYEYDIHNSLNTLASGIGGYSITTAPTVSGQIPTWNPAENEYKPQVPFTNELLGQSIASEHPIVSGQTLIWRGIQWGPQFIFPDTPLPQMTWISNSTITVASYPSVSGPTRITLQNGTQYVLPGPITFNFALGATELGLDTGTEAASTWYYMYCVPKLGSSTELTLCASTRTPLLGPSGYSIWKYIGAFRNNASSNIIQFYQYKSKFIYAARLETVIVAGKDATPVRFDLNTYVPKTTESTYITLYQQTTTGYGNMFGWVTGQQGGGSSTAFFITASPINYSGQFSDSLIPCPGTTKEIYYQRTSTAGINYSTISVMGWIDEYLL